MQAIAGTLSRKNVAGLQGHFTMTASTLNIVPENAEMMSDWERQVTENSTGRERSSVPDETSTVTKRL